MSPAIRPHGPLGCGFLAEPDVDALLAGGLDQERRDGFQQHVASGCHDCALLMADLDAFAEVARSGPSAVEREEFERTREMLGARVRRELRASRAPVAAPAWGTGAPGWGFALAVAAALVVMVALPLMQTSRPYSVPLPGEQSVAVEAMPFVAPPVVRGDARVEAWSRVQDALAAGRYNAAATELRGITRVQPAIADAWLYRGIAELLNGRPSEAADSLSRARALAVEQDLPAAATNWYLGLARLGIGQPDEARTALREAVAAGGPFGDQARELLRQLDDVKP